MPLPKARKGAKKKARQKVVGKVMHELSSKGATARPRKQKIAIALKQAGLARKKKKR
jgi:hypothetical protein